MKDQKNKYAASAYVPNCPCVSCQATYRTKPTTHAAIKDRVECVRARPSTHGRSRVMSRNKASTASSREVEAPSPTEPHNVRPISGRRGHCDRRFYRAASRRGGPLHWRVMQHVARLRADPQQQVLLLLART